MPQETVGPEVFVNAPCSLLSREQHVPATGNSLNKAAFKSDRSGDFGLRFTKKFIATRSCGSASFCGEELQAKVRLTRGKIYSVFSLPHTFENAAVEEQALSGGCSRLV